MTTPGSNLLVQALRMIRPSTVIYYKATGRATNEILNDVTTYAPPVVVRNGAMQPIAKDRYGFLGLDLDKNYSTWFVPQAVVATERDSSGDQIEYNGRRLQCTSSTDWVFEDGWCSITCIDIGAAHVG